MILHELLSYDVLRVIWWLLLGILLVGFAVTDGFDLGAAALLRATGKTDVERRVVINTIERISAPQRIHAKTVERLIIRAPACAQDNARGCRSPD